VKDIYVNTTTRDHKSNELSIQTGFVQMYNNIYAVAFNLKYQCSLYLLIWIVDEMSDYNQIILNKGNRSEFRSRIRSFNREYTDGMVKAAIGDLINSELLISASMDGKREASYLVSPKYFWKTKSQKDRIETIQAFQNQLNTKINERDIIRSGSETEDANRSGEAEQSS